MSGLFGGAKKSVNPAAPIISSVRLQTSSSSRPIPVVFGRARVAGNLLWYSDFTPIAHTTTQSSGGKGGGGGKQSSTTYTYQAAVIIGLCEGPAASIGTVWKDKEVHTLTDLNLWLYGGGYSQTPDTYLTTNHPTQALAYRGTAYLISTVYQLDGQAGLPNHTFEVNGQAQYGAGIVDSNPKDVLYAVLTDSNYGMGFATSSIGDLTQFSNYCVANGIFISPAYTAQELAHGVIDRIIQIGNSGIFWSEDKIKVVPYGDVTVTGNGVTFTPNLTPIYDLNDDDFLGTATSDPIRTTRSTQADAFNQLTINFFNRKNAYADQPEEFKDQSNVEMYGLRPSSPISLEEIADPGVARTVVQLVGQRILYQRNMHEFKLGYKYSLLELMDIVTINDPVTGLITAPVRLTQIDEDEYGGFSITAEDVLSGVNSHAIYQSQLAGGYNADYNSPAGGINPPVIFDSPGAITALGYELCLGVSGITTTWGGCDVWVSTDNATFKQVGSIHGPSRHGALSSAFAVGTDPDTVNSCAVDLTTSRGQLISGTNADADNLSTLCYVGGELIAYKTATLTGTNKYSLGGYIRRGVYNTPITQHLSGSPFLRMDQAIGSYAYDPTLIGSTIWLKFPSFNVYGSGNQSIADVPAYPYTIKGPLGAPVAMTDLAISGTVLTWTAVAGLTYVFRMHYGSNLDWGTASPLHSGTVSASPFDLVSLPYASITILGKAVDKYGVQSLNFATIYTDLGDAPIANIVETIPISPTFSGTLDNCLLVSGELVANAADSFYGDDAQSFYGLDTESFYKPSAGFGRMVFTTDVITIATVLAGSNMALALSTTGADVTIEYRIRGEGSDAGTSPPPASAFAVADDPFNALDPNSYSAIDIANFNPTNINSFAIADPATFTPPPPVAPMGDWKFWPRSIVAKPTDYQWRITIGSGAAPGKIRSMSVTVDAPDMTEGLGDIAISATGTVIPYTKPFYAIKFITIGALQPGTSGATKVNIDKTNPLAPVVTALNGSTPVSGAKVDFLIGGY